MLASFVILRVNIEYHVYISRFNSHAPGCIMPYGKVFIFSAVTLYHRFLGGIRKHLAAGIHVAAFGNAEYRIGKDRLLAIIFKLVVRQHFPSAFLHHFSGTDVLCAGIGQAVADIFGSHLTAVGKFHVLHRKHIPVKVCQPGHQFSVGIELQNGFAHPDTRGGPAVIPFRVIVRGH